MSELVIQSHDAPRGRPAVAAASRHQGSAWSSPVIALALTFVVPGAGHLLIGRHRRGLVLLAIVLAMIVAVLIWTPRTSIGLAAAVSQPRVLLALLVADATVWLLRVFALIDVWRIAWLDALRGPRAWKPRLIIGIVLLLASLPHLLFAYYDVLTYRFLHGTFGQQPAIERPAAPEAVQVSREIEFAAGVEPEVPIIVATETRGDP